MVFSLYFKKLFLEIFPPFDINYGIIVLANIGSKKLNIPLPF